jgi:5,5'-dehydrodivanillate O-demethylase oxygenase subunit
MGALLRRYWHPIAGLAELDDDPVKKVRLLGEDLVLYRDNDGNLGLIDEPCPHRRVSMEFGIPEQEGLRCPYHGWVMNHEGRCLEQPGEPVDSTFKDRVSVKAYKVRGFAGLVFAYMGPEPAPLLPRYDAFVWDNALRHIGFTMLPCNWVQCMENSLDPIHVEWLHGRFMDYVWERMGQPKKTQYHARHMKIGFDHFEHGIIKRRVVEGNSEEDDPWKVGHAVLFPDILRTGGGRSGEFQFRVPVDDTHTLHVSYAAYRPGVPVPPQESVPVYQVPLVDESGRFLTQINRTQDFWAWVSQGPVAERDLERLGESDIGIIMYRELLKQQMEISERGEDPMEVYRNPEENECIELPGERVSYDVHEGRMQRKTASSAYRPEQFVGKFSPLFETINDVFSEAERRSAAGEELLAPVPTPVYPVARGHREVVLRP